MSVNGRPFKPDPTSYQMTGIPAGHYKRYQSRGVVRMTPDKTIPYENQQIGIPGKGTETEAEKQFKELLMNQLDTSQIQANKRLKFSSKSKVEAIGCAAAGFQTLNQFRETEVNEKRSRELRDAGFTEMQVATKLSYEGHVDTYVQQKIKSSFGAHPDFVKSGISDMQEKLGNIDKTRDEEGPIMSRHMLQVEYALLQGKKDHPLAWMFLEKHVEGGKEESENMQRLKNGGANDEHLGSSNGSSSKDSENGKEPVVLSAKIDDIPESEIVSKRVSAEEITKIPQFAKYERGTPSKVLFLKNMDKGVTVEDLVSLFVRFQDGNKEKISFKLLTGRMKGQAFVTFADEVTATKALELVNGYVLREKPIVIEFGKSK